MDVEIWTSDPDAVDPAEVREALEKAGWMVRTVSVNDRCLGE